jgi:Ser/Thr protein kinase RdoA (MazF antagonist)
MKLTKKELNTVCKEYNLGKVKSIKPMTSGWVNFSFDLKTDKGAFVVQIIGDKLSDYKKANLEREFKLLKYLKKKKFPYKIPYPILNSKGKEILHIASKNLWVYNKIKGNITEKQINLKQYRQIAKALALFHKYTKNFKGTENDEKREVDWLFLQYKKISKIKPKDEVDKIMLENVGLFSKVLQNVKDIHDGKKNILHDDFTERNCLFVKGKLVGIIDFDNVRMKPIERDFAISIKRIYYITHQLTQQKTEIFLKEYRKYYPFPKSKEKNLIKMALRDNCMLFWWFYEGMNKNNDKRYQSLLWLAKETKDLVKKSKIFSNKINNNN